ncbi:hotdog family protein [Sphingobacterium hungaricum]|uniref:3-hydroxyacyl-ACP dehydratase n=1 Tax=Sphingobacterium hungaricum TaxID=2082723 RepID=A0A928YQ70_9SPHI|nr:hypothetical protein [Sphingobacterium hungaricum]MBE8713891.1 3-hydroxyacyl-ACP dehydratase [Sphingobacterium hungaricum]
MLLEDFYQVNQFTQEAETKYSIEIQLNKLHAIFKGHFPGNPITPGVCMIQMIKELCERITEQELFMHQVNMIKFMALINPELNPNLRLEIDIQPSDESNLKVKNNIYMDDVLAMKFSGSFKLKN